jgi:hypothetical protein
MENNLRTFHFCINLKNGAILCKQTAEVAKGENSNILTQDWYLLFPAELSSLSTNSANKEICGVQEYLAPPPSPYTFVLYTETTLLLHIHIPLYICVSTNTEAIHLSK